MDVDRAAPVIAEAHAVVRAPVGEVWRVLTDIAGWPRWNREVARVELSGAIAPGATFRWKAGGVTIVSTIQELRPERRIVWTGRAPGLRAVHVWELAPHPDGARVRTEESFDGLLARLLPGYLRRMLARTLAQGLDRLKREAERRPGGSPS